MSIDIIADSDEPRVAGSGLVDISRAQTLPNRHSKKIKQTPSYLMRSRGRQQNLDRLKAYGKEQTRSCLRRENR